MKTTVASRRAAGLKAAALPVGALILFLITILIFKGADGIAPLAPVALAVASLTALVVARHYGQIRSRALASGLARSARQVLPAIPMLLCIAALSTTWMLSGVVPTLVDYGLQWLNPRWFPLTVCAISAVVSILTGSSWSTIATIGVSFMGIGELMGFSAGWIAGAVISGAYFGDKISPLSDTTVVAASTCGVDLFRHIRYMLLTSIPAFSIALAVYALAGTLTDTEIASHTSEFLSELHRLYNISPYTLIIPALTLTLILLRINTLITLAISALAGAAGVFIFQNGYPAASLLKDVVLGHTASAENELLSSLLSTGGILGMLPTVMLVICAMIFGGVMMGTGFLGILSNRLGRRLKTRGTIVSATVAGGLSANACTADQYLSIIITGNMFKGLYRKQGLENRLLSRTVEDSVSVTSVLIPWNSCGVTHSAVLGVATTIYFPFCVFNYMSPVMSILMARIANIKMKNYRLNRKKVVISQP
ncbi:MAG: sodium:proton antiporter [Muribaculaceae bacterium]|nr:sodium:proton antiporter [Muribaculaceae bacterium]